MKTPIRLIAVAIFTVARVMQAQEAPRDPRSVQPERPTVATHAHTVASGYVEIEAGVQGDRIAPGDRFYFAPIVAKIGLTDHLQMNFTPPIVLGSANGIGDMAIGLKWRVLDDHPVLGDFAILPSLQLTNGNGRNLSGTLISSHEVGGVAIDLNAVYTREHFASHIASDAALWTASFGTSLTPKLGWVLEFFGEPTIDGSGAPSTASVLTGPTFLVSTAFAIDLGVIAPWHGDAPNSIYAGGVWNLGKFFSSSSLARLKSRH